VRPSDDSSSSSSSSSGGSSGDSSSSSGSSDDDDGDDDVAVDRSSGVRVAPTEPAMLPVRGFPDIGIGMPGMSSEPGIDPVDLDECEPVSKESYDEDFCMTEMSCNEEEYFYAECHTWESKDGNVDCYCGGSTGAVELQFVGELSTVCEDIVEICAKGIDPDFTEPAVCTPKSRSTNEDYCSMETECVQSVEISPGVVVEFTDWQYNNCWDNDGTWVCQCGKSGSMIGFEADASEMACTDAFELCDEPLVASDNWECEPTGQQTYDNYCNANMQCTRTGTLGSFPVKLQGSLYTNCQEDTEGEWKCACQLGEETTEYTISERDDWEACGQALERCASAMGVADY
jgi:hypothetical protein